MIYRETMRLKLLLAEYKKTWVISTIGIVLYAFGIAVLNTNEGKPKVLNTNEGTVNISELYSIVF